MKRASWIGRGLAGLLLAGFLCTSPAVPQSPSRPGPRLEAVAETKLLMEGLNQANFRGLDKILRQEPASDEVWSFARGQALLIAETGNLLLLRPPRNPGESLWQERSSDLRAVATRVARATAAKDYAKSKAAFIDLANACNRCHQSFRVTAKVEPFADPGGREGDKKLP